MTTQQEQALRQVFNELPVAFPGRDDAGNIRMINFEILRDLLDRVSDSSLFLKGYQEGYESACKMTQDVVSEVFLGS